MTGHDVPDRDMPNFLWPGHRDAPMIGDASLAALLAGTELPPGSAPELRPLVETLAELRAQAAGDELHGEAETLSAFRSQFGAPRMAHRPSARTPPLRRLRPVKAVVAAATVLSLSSIATAAYAGTLPAPVQRLAHDIIGAPRPDSPQPALTASSPRTATPGDPAYGLCPAWAHAKAHGTRKQQAAAFDRLSAAAGGPGEVAAYCATATLPGTSPSQLPQPTPTPHGTARPPGLPAPHGSGRPSVLPPPHGPGAPTVRPTPHSTGKPSGLPTPGGSARAKSTAAAPRPM